MNALRALEVAVVGPSVALMTTWLLDHALYARNHGGGGGLSGAASCAANAVVETASEATCAAKSALVGAAVEGARATSWTAWVLGGVYEAVVPPVATSSRVLVGVALALTVASQLLPFVRRSHYDLHRTMGKVAFPFVVAFEYQLASMLWAHGVSGLGPSEFLLDAVNWLTIAVCYALGVNAIFVRREVGNHRGLMMLMAAALASSPSQRFWHAVLRDDEGSTYVDWSAVATPLSVAAAFVQTYGLALMFGAFTRPYDDDVAQANGPGSAQAKQRLAEQGDEGAEQETRAGPVATTSKSERAKRAKHAKHGNDAKRRGDDDDDDDHARERERPVAAGDRAPTPVRSS